MITKAIERKVNNTNSIDSIVAKVAGATQVAGAAVSETMAIKDEALDMVNAFKAQSSNQKKDQAIKKIKLVTKYLKK